MFSSLNRSKNDRFHIKPYDFLVQKCQKVAKIVDFGVKSRISGSGPGADPKITKFEQPSALGAFFSCRWPFWGSRPPKWPLFSGVSDFSSFSTQNRQNRPKSTKSSILGSFSTSGSKMSDLDLRGSRSSTFTSESWQNRRFCFASRMRLSLT